MPSKTVGKRVLKEARATIAQSQYNLKRTIIELQQERRAIHQERADTLRALARLAERLTIQDLAFDQPLDVLITFIADQLAARIQTATSPPSPLSPTSIEQDGSRFRATCTCNWRSSWSPRERDAALAAITHEERLHAQT